MPAEPGNYSLKVKIAGWNPSCGRSAGQPGLAARGGRSAGALRL